LMVSKLEELGLPLIMTSFEDERVVDLSHVETNENVSYIDDFKVALESAQEKYEIVFVTGSLHFISQVRAFLKEN
ncbi:MAG TPA: FolC protein, partial [Kandleria vitulina]|nr:FolC protein [Kandleria vitulina]